MTSPKSPRHPTPGRGSLPKAKSGPAVPLGVRIAPDLHAWVQSQPGTQRETVEAGLRLLMQLGGLVPSEQWTDAEVIAEVARRGLFTPKPPEGGNHE